MFVYCSMCRPTQPTYVRSTTVPHPMSCWNPSDHWYVLGVLASRSSEKAVLGRSEKPPVASSVSIVP